MAIIPLRVYNRDIEGMIDNGQLDEAVGHCRHILATYPKHIATYRLLGKAHLEQQRISDATDIFQRVLSAIPDDFIANVGMSIIREDENNLDASIWHMELAYESQPSNVAIQDELRRLYGRRDGMQPPKVRLTRGALARMYAKGGLVDQALAELRSAVAEDPNRPDLQLLLANMHFQNSQRVEAVEICANILKKLPFCLAANQILAVCLPVSESADTRKNYRQVAISMDPYFAFAAMDAITSDQVPENAVNIEKLEWKSGIQAAEVPAQPTWATSLGISLSQPEDEKLPDWLKEAEAPVKTDASAPAQSSVSPFIWDTQEVEKIITDASKPEGEIPDWMKDAGWEPASAESVEQPPEPITEPEPEKEQPQEDLAQGDMPDWLRGIAPLAFTEERLSSEQPPASDTTLPWLDQQRPGPTDSIIQWLETKEPDQPAAPPVQEILPPETFDEVPDWLKDLEMPYPPEVQADTGGALPTTPAFLEEPVTGEPATQPPEEASTLQEFLNQVDKVEPAPPAPELTPAPEAAILEEQPAAFTDELPDWIKELAGEPPASSTTEPETESEAGAPAFLGEMPSVEAPSAPEVEEAIPGEIAAMAALSQTEEQVGIEPPVAEGEKPASEPSGFAGEAMAAAFLTGLVAHEREEEAPPPAEIPEAEADAWMKLEEPVTSEETLSGAETQVPVIPTIPEMETPAEEITPSPAVDVPEWIIGLGETPELETPVTEPPAELTPEAEIAPAEELPEWLLDFEQPAEEPAEQAPVPEALEWKEEELPDWIKELTDSTIVEAPSPEATVSAEPEISQPEGETPVKLPPLEASEVLESEKPEDIDSILKTLTASMAVTRMLAPKDEEEQVPETPSVEQAVTPVAETIETEVPIVATDVAAVEVEEPVAMVEEPTEIPFAKMPELAEVEAAEELLPTLDDARSAINQGATQQAAELFTQLIKRKQHLPEVIMDLQEALYRFPVDVNLWVTLGDAYTQSDDLKEALSTLSKAEDLVR